jgi:hypothetical protein
MVAVLLGCYWSSAIGRRGRGEGEGASGMEDGGMEDRGMEMEDGGRDGDEVERRESE